ncbi:heat shock protein GrpE [Liquorilactobacillus sucicola DSM 21376 = JCM 15457]|uniref:Protein GrpE n=1 Tax=Liquorilactobacillus sucicola DSM 21376 = JCM 15457 TaxID=1423806 RepID=A0A023CU97_9LACO|nr:GrpE protein [Liquorilactobacillus sucicola DSM 21376 = JCM 15457]GAJ25458.1 heat shock protein GrpE [Liquorilactobacillus sucicola DSM 21376 = JCM 15457]
MSEKNTQDFENLSKETSKEKEIKEESPKTGKNKRSDKAASSSEKVDQETKASEAKSEDQSEDLLKKVTELKQKYDEVEDKYLRAEAEMANMNTRFKKEQEKLLKYDGQNLAKDVLPVIDNLDRALKIEVEDEASKQIKRGIELVYKDMEKALSANHIIKIEALGQAFDPTKHQAVKSVQAENGQKPETVVEVFQDGYMLKDRVLRPAMVVVAQ